MWQHVAVICENTRLSLNKFISRQSWGAEEIKWQRSDKLSLLLRRNLTLLSGCVKVTSVSIHFKKDGYDFAWSF